jgi:hypothetical protein
VWATPSSFHDTASAAGTGGRPLHPGALQETRGIQTDVSSGLVLAQQVRPSLSHRSGREQGRWTLWVAERRDDKWPAWKSLSRALS